MPVMSVKMLAIVSKTHKIRLLITHHFRQSDLIESERALKEMDFETWQAYQVYFRKNGKHI